MKQELKLLKEIIRDYTPESYDYEPEEGSPKAKQSDYDLVTVIPVSDPNAATMAQKIVQYQAVLQLAQGAPQIYNMPQLHRQMLEVLGIRNPQKLIPLPEDKKPKDPISENMDVINNKPLKAFIYQDQDAHITAHTNFMKDPLTAKTIGQNPQAQVMMAALQAHIAEHFGFKYRQLIEQQLGAPLPYLQEDEDTIPEEYEVQISRLIAQASAQLLQQNQAQASQEQAQQQQQDPIIQMQQQELALKAQDLQIKQQKTQADIEIEHMRVGIEKMRVESQERIAGATLGAQSVKSEKDSEIKQFVEGTKMGIQAVKDNAEQELRKEQAQLQHHAQMEQVKVQQRNQQPKE
jgi:hypothetical protein